MRPLGGRPCSASSHRPARSTDDLRGKLRALRTVQGLTLEDLARSVGLSKSALSQIESGRIDPSLETLRRLVQAQKVTLASLFETRAAVDDRVVRHDQRKVFRIPRNQLRYELLSPDLVGKRVEFLRVELDPAKGEKPAYAHEGEESASSSAGGSRCSSRSTYVLGPATLLTRRPALRRQRGPAHGRDDLGHRPADLLAIR